MAAGPPPERVPGGEPPADDACPNAPGPGGLGRGATSLRAAPAIEPPKLTSGRRRTATGFPVIPDDVAPGAWPRRDGTEPAARRRVRGGISVTGHVTAGVNSFPPRDRMPAGPSPIGRPGPAVDVGPGPAAGRPGPPAAVRRIAPPPNPEATAPQDVSEPRSDGYHHSGGRTGRSTRAGEIGIGPAIWRRIRGA